MTSSLSTIRGDCRQLLGDNDALAGYVFDDTQMDYWINGAVAALSLRFPLRISTKIDCTTGVHEYDDLSELTQQIISVEYPDGQDPPQYLTRKSHKDPDFYDTDLYYDFIPVGGGDSTRAPILIISASPDSSEDIIAETLQDHPSMSGSPTISTLPDRLNKLIPLFVRWKAWSELAATEAMKHTDPSAALESPVATYELAAKRAEDAWWAALRDAEVHYSQSALIPPWSMDKYDRIY